MRSVVFTVPGSYRGYRLKDGRLVRDQRRLSVTDRLTPAMAAGVRDRLWEVADIVKVLEDWEESQ